MSDLFVDLETRSRIDLKAAGARRYAADPSTQITTAVWQFRNVMKTACTVHSHLGTHTITVLYDDIRTCSRFVAHHANFDVNVLRRQNPFVEIPLSKIDCTMGRAQALALPGGLDQVCTALGIKGKDPRGRALVTATCKPQRDGTFNEDPQTFRDLLEYNVQDVRCLIELDNRLPPLSENERLVFERTWRKNEIGLPIDIELATAIALRRQEIEQETAQKLIEWTSGAVTKLSQRQRIMEWCNSGNRAAGLESTQKHVVADKLTDDNLHPDVRLVLELLAAEGGSAPLKAQALLDRHVNGFYKDATRYFGARSGRGTSEGANLFNIARPSGKYDGKNGRPTIDSIIHGLKQGFRYDNKALTDCLRGCIVAPPEWMICDNDLANAELRIALWQASDRGRLDILSSGKDLYMHNAVDMFNLPAHATKETYPKERQAGKSLTLGAGYQLGWKTYLAFLIKTAAETGLRKHELTELKARSDIEGYRKINPKLVQLWNDLADAFRFAIYEAPGRIFPAGKIAFQKDTHGTVWMLLPCGRTVPHYSAHITPEGEMNFFRGKFGAMMRQKAFGGSLLEIACFAGDTEVLTNTGFRRIDAVTAYDLVWDGVEWVPQKGAVCQGKKVVVGVCGTRVTSDHLILCSETPIRWAAVGDMSSSELKLATVLAHSLLPGGLNAPKVTTCALTWLFNVVAKVRKKSNVAVTSDWCALVGVPFALEKCLSTMPRLVHGAIFVKTTPYDLNLLQPSMALLEDATIRNTGHGSTMVPVVSKYFGCGMAMKVRALFCGILRHFPDMIILLLNWIASTTTEITNRKTSVFQHVKNKCLIAEKLMTSKRSEPVYDLLDCGPRNRFMIRTQTGHFLLAHNCQSLTRSLITTAEADIENELPDVVLILDVYDSILALAPAAVAKERSAQIREIMKRPRSWTAGLPLDCEGYEAQRMSK